MSNASTSVGDDRSLVEGPLCTAPVHGPSTSFFRTFAKDEWRRLSTIFDLQTVFAGKNVPFRPDF